MQFVNHMTATATVEKRTAARWLFIAPTLFLLVLVNQLDKTNIAVIIANHKFLSDMSLLGQPARIGLVSTVFFLGYGFGLLLWGFVVDRIGPRRSAMLGVCGWALTTAWCALAHSMTELSLARFALGLAEGCIWPVCNTYSARWFPAGERGRIQSVWVNGNQVGLALGLPLVTLLVAPAGWRMTFFVFGIGSLILLQPLLIFLAPDDPEQSSYANQEERWYVSRDRVKDRVKAQQTHVAAIMSLLGTPRFLLITLCHAGTVATLFGLTTWIPTYLTQVRGLPFNSLAGWVALSYTLPIAAALGVGYLADRTMRPAIASAVTGAVVAIMVVLSVVVSGMRLSVLLLVTSLAAPMIYGAMNASIMQTVALPEQIGRATGIFVGIGNLIGGLAPVIIGYLIGAFRGRYVAAFAFVSAVNLALVGFYLLVDRGLQGRLGMREA